MKRRGCFAQTLFVMVLALAFGASSYFWFKYFVRGRSVSTPNMIGRPLADATAAASDIGIAVDVDPARDRHSNSVPLDAVVWQNRAPGTLVKRGARIIIGRSLGPQIITVPELGGESARTAQLRFGQRNLRLGAVSNLPLPGAEGVVAVDPPAGTVVAAQTDVALLVAVPPAPTRWVMPDLVDRQLERIRPAIESRGLTVGNVRFESYPGIADGTIIRQFPTPGAPVTRGDSITLVVARNSAPEPEQRTPAPPQSPAGAVPPTSAPPAQAPPQPPTGRPTP